MAYEGHRPSADAADRDGSYEGDCEASPGAHEPPRITRLGTVAELTLGFPNENGSDGTFPGSQFT